MGHSVTAVFLATLAFHIKGVKAVTATVPEVMSTSHVILAMANVFASLMSLASSVTSAR